MPKKKKHKTEPTGYYIDPPSCESWEVHAALGIPYIGGPSSFLGDPTQVISGSEVHCDLKLPLKVAKTCRELTATPEIIQQVCSGLFRSIFLGETNCEFEISARIKKAEKLGLKLMQSHMPNDGISGNCDLPVDEHGSFVGWCKQNSPFLPDVEFPTKAELNTVLAFWRARATALYSWQVSYLIRSMQWQPQPPLRFVFTTKAGKEREVFDFRTPLDKLAMNCLNVVLQAIFMSQLNSHGYVAGRGVFTAIGQVKWLLSQGYHWVQTLDVRKAFKSMARTRVLKTLKAIVGAQVKKVPYLPQGLPDKQQRLLEAEQLIDLVVCVDKAKDRKTGKLVDVSDHGLLQGCSLSGVFFNMCLDRLDKKFLPLPGAEVAYVRYADNIFVLAKSEAAAKEAFQTICSYMASYGAKVRREHPIVNLFKTLMPISFIGVNLHFDKKGNPTAKLAPARLHRLAERIVELSSIERMFQGINAVFRFYARGGLLNDCAVKGLANALKVAAKAGSGGAGAGGGSIKSVYNLKTLLKLKDSALGKLSGITGGEDEEQDIEDALNELLGDINDVS